ncbi:MAG: glycosyltransferase family 39 protein [Crocinitomicaceae bacterium]
MESILNFYRKSPYTVILIVAIFLRVLASIFSQGYLMHDDHFLIIESGGSWADGRDAMGWLPGTEVSWEEPQGHSLLFPGLNMLWIMLIKLFGVQDPKLIMIFVRLFTSIFSILTVVYGIKLARKITDEKKSILIGWVLAILWILPFLGVRSLVEVVSIPFLILAIYQIKLNELQEKGLWAFIWAGIFLGIAFSVRYQTALFTFGVGLVLVFQKKWIESLLLTVGFAIPVLLSQGLIDFLIWGRPFAEMKAYIDYNATHSDSYVLAAWWSYPLLLMLAGLSFINLGWFIGFFKVFKKYLIISLPVFIFLAFHTYFPNRQERFILPVVPLFMMLGIIGWETIVSERSKSWLIKLNKTGIWMFFILNLSVGLFLDFSYSKMTRVEGAYYLYQKNETGKFSILIENTGGGKVPQYPKFYSQNWNTFEFYLGGPNDFEKFRTWWQMKHPGVKYIMFFNKKNLDVRLDTIRKYYPNIEEDTIIRAEGIDKILHELNPRNNNHDLFIYKVSDYHSIEEE